MRTFDLMMGSQPTGFPTTSVKPQAEAGAGARQGRVFGAARFLRAAARCSQRRSTGYNTAEPVVTSISPRRWSAPASGPEPTSDLGDSDPDLLGLSCPGRGSLCGRLALGYQEKTQLVYMEYINRNINSNWL